MANLILAGDIGGTNTRLALFDEAQQPRDIRQYSSTKYPGLEPIVAQYLQDTGATKAPFTRAGFGVAGPVEQGPFGSHVHGTNLSWGVKQSELALSLGLEPNHVGILNDLAANALGATVVAHGQTVVLHAGEEVHGHRAIISAGTGLGVAGLYWDGTNHRAFPSEGGHSNFGPRNEREDALLEYLRGRQTDHFNGHVSWERVLSGPGLFNLFDFLRHAGIAEQKVQIPDGAKPGEAAKLISKAGMDGSCPRSVEALNWFASLYGAAAGNVAIQFLALGGIYIGGGIAPKIIEKLKTPAFLDAFLEKGPLKEQVLQRIPVRVVLDEYAALRGAALFAGRLDLPFMPIKRHMNDPMNTSAATMTTTRQLIDQGIAAGLHIGAQVYVSINGEPVADLAFGDSRPGVAMTPDTLMLWLSGGKPIGAVAIAQLWERGMLGLDDPVARHIPEFGQNGKEAITVRHILTHTAGFRWVETGWPAAPWDRIIARICAAPQERGWIAGKRAGYSPYSSWFILGELVRRLDGRDFDRYVREEIFEPLGMHDSWIALPADRYYAYGNRIGIMQTTDKEGGPIDAGLDTEQAAGASRPAGGARGPARELGRFYEMMLGFGPGARDEPGAPGGGILPQTIEALVARHRTGMKDTTFNHVMDWGLGFQVNSAIYGPDTVPYGFGPHASPRAYGHGGSQSSASFADPEHGLAVVVLCNGMPGEAAHQKRIRAILVALYQDLGIRDEQG